MPTFKSTVTFLALLPAAVHGQGVERAHRDSTIKTYVAGDFSYVDFRGTIDPWRLASLSFGHATSAGSIVGRLNYANRFATSGAQGEVDAYPRLNASTYAYLNAGYSASDIFPQWRFGGELFRSLPNAWEASLGFRQLRFGGPPVTLLTGAVGRYSGNYWVSVRPYVRVKPTGTSASAGITARRYFADGNHYFGARASYGSSPSDRVTPDEVSRTSSYSADLHGSGGPWLRAIATWAIGFEREELSPRRFRRSWTGTTGMKFTF